MGLSLASMRSTSRWRPHSPSLMERSARKPRTGSFASMKRSKVLTRSRLGHAAPASPIHDSTAASASRHNVNCVDRGSRPVDRTLNPDTLLITYHLSPITYHLSPITYHLSPGRAAAPYNTRFQKFAARAPDKNNAALRTHDLHERVPAVPGPAHHGKADPAV